MSFLKCKPSVFAIEDRYEIIVFLKENGVCRIKIGNETFYEENSGVLSSEKNFLKISFPQKVLNDAKKYEIIYRKTIDRKAYYSELGEEETESFVFRPIEKTENIKIYHIADVHYSFDTAKNLAKYYGNDTDLFILNGDIGEVETAENYYAVCEFAGEISQGEIPMVFVRGNHDTRGKLAEDYCKYFPNINGKTYFTFEIGNIVGVVLDCGEDKEDNLVNYGGVNIFHEYRLKETEFIKNLRIDGKDKTVFAICHICPSMTTFNKGDIFDIERDIYSVWNKELERLGVKFMLCGHYHKTFILSSDDERNIIEHAFPVIVGSANKDNGYLEGLALTLNKNDANVKFTNTENEVVFETDIKF